MKLFENWEKFIRQELGEGYLERTAEQRKRKKLTPGKTPEQEGTHEQNELQGNYNERCGAISRDS